MRLEVESVSIDFGSARIVSDVALQTAPGEMVGLVGPNGRGKSTLLRSGYRALRPVGCAALIGGETG